MFCVGGRLCISGGAILVLMMLGNAFATEPPLVQPKRVLILHSHSRASPTTLEWERGITTGLEAIMLEPVAVDVEQLCDRLSEKTKGMSVLFLSHERDRDGTVTKSPCNVAEQISRASSVPVLGLYHTLMGSEIPFSGTEMNRIIFDWRQMGRWGISEKNLPEGSIVMFREPMAWDRY